MVSSIWQSVFFHESLKRLGPAPLLLGHDVSESLAQIEEELGGLALEELLAGDRGLVLEEEGLCRHVLGKLGVDLVTGGDVGEWRDAEVDGMSRGEVSGDVLDREAAVEGVESLRVSGGKALDGHGVQEALEHVLLTLAALLVE